MESPQPWVTFNGLGVVDEEQLQHMLKSPKRLEKVTPSSMHGLWITLKMKEKGVSQLISHSKIRDSKILLHTN